MSEERKEVLQRKSFALAIRAVKLHQYLAEQKHEYVISKQMLRAGTSVGANVREAQNAESKADFVHKYGIAQKEADEMIYWLELLQATDYLTDKEFDSIKGDAEQVLKMIQSAILTTKQGQTKPKPNG
jgi:four helix bundle protein